MHAGIHVGHVSVRGGFTFTIFQQNAVIQCFLMVFERFFVVSKVLVDNGDVVQGITNVFVDFEVLVNFQRINLVLKGIFQATLLLCDYPEFVVNGCNSK